MKDSKNCFKNHLLQYLHSSVNINKTICRNCVFPRNASNIIDNVDYANYRPINILHHYNDVPTVMLIYFS